MKIFIAGHKGMVGSAIYKKLSTRKDVELHVINKSLLDLLDQTRVTEYFYNNNFDIVIDCAAKVGGIHSNNTFRANFIYENLQIQNNLIHASYLSDVKKFLFLGSSCIYPKFADQPIKEEYLLTSPLEYTNEINNSLFESGISLSINIKKMPTASAKTNKEPKKFIILSIFIFYNKYLKTCYSDYK